MNTRSVVILGGGNMGTALAALCARNGAEVIMWSIEQDVVASINGEHHNHRYLLDVELPHTVVATGTIAEALARSTTVISALPTQVVSGVFSEHAEVFTSDHHLLSASKGFDVATGKTMSHLVHAAAPHLSIAVLMGPLFANEIARGLPSVALLASSTETVRALFKKVLVNDTFRVHESADVVGAEAAGALKNIYAILMGIVAGSGYGWNTKSAFITVAMHEIADLVAHVGGVKETAYGLAGLGDLVTTGFGEQSRNRRFGEALCNVRSVEEALASVGQVVEGVKTLESIPRVCAGFEGRLPLLELTQQLVRGTVNPCAALETFIKEHI